MADVWDKLNVLLTRPSNEVFVKDGKLIVTIPEVQARLVFGDSDRGSYFIHLQNGMLMPVPKNVASTLTKLTNDAANTSLNAQIGGIYARLQ